jgi:DNA-binding transcriptional LysR family regulator
VHKLNWDDLRFVLAVAETGSVNAAARALGVNHATVLRRIAAFEESCGGPVFERDKSGYRLRPDRANVIDAARLAAQHVLSVEALMRGSDGTAGTALRLTSTDTFCQTVLAHMSPALMRRILPDRLTILSSNAHLDMARLRADLALRPALHLSEELSGRQIAVMRFGLYSLGKTKDRWLGLGGPLGSALPAKWMTTAVAPEQIVASADSFCVLAEMAAQGLGQVILPCILGDRNPELSRRSGDIPDFEVPVWIACHRDLAGNEKLRRVMETIEKLMQPHLPALEGRA